VATLAEYGCSPTLPTPGSVVLRYPQFIRSLQDGGVEIAVHSYDHVDLAAYPPLEASKQLARAAQVFAQHGIHVHGFRCPYLSCTDELLDALPEGMFGYSSNKAVWWDVVSSAETDETRAGLDVLQRLYRPASAEDTVCLPCTGSSMIEIPVCLPDDLQLHDALHLSDEEMVQAWTSILDRTHQRGELFTLLFHPELAASCEQPLVAVLRGARTLQPAVWIARLRDISNWWREKSSFAVEIEPAPAGLRLSFICSQRATILAKGLDKGSPAQPWDREYCRLEGSVLEMPANPLPFVGLPAEAPAASVGFLREQGYVVKTGENGARCATYLDRATLATLTTEVQLIARIEASPGPLVRYGRWPDGAKSALCVTGDLDALSLLDYASRLLAR
jgi:hypothetical protein